MDDVLNQILARLSVLEATVGHNGGPPLDEEPDRRLSTTAVAARYGVSTRTIERWTRDPKLKFPQPDIVNLRKYWWASALRRHDRERSATSSPCSRYRVLPTEMNIKSR